MSLQVKAVNHWKPISKTKFEIYSEELRQSNERLSISFKEYQEVRRSCEQRISF